ncbi:moesin-like [Sycon ciliatum]|uniref:moesin-like n=1 Tax=Sycon ciliatum TaxID=27933 RepID=UPI0020ACF893|eukprot:scpid58472/ scgid11477/ Radixin; ESP10
MPKQSSVRVLTVDSELEFTIQATTTGKNLFEQVLKSITLREVWFFGLQYVDTKDSVGWLKMDKKILSQDIKKDKDGMISLDFRAKFYPEDVGEELIQEVTQRLFYLQIRELILKEDIYCPPETAVLLASYAVHAKFGDYDKSTHKQGFLAVDKILPKRVLDQHHLDMNEWEERIVTWYSEHRGMLKEDAMLEYLKIAQDLEMYGVNYFDIKNKKGSELYLGVDALGLNVFSSGDKLTPKIGFPWSEIKNISFNDKKFVIKPIDKKAPDFVFYSPRLKINKRILSLCIGNHELYIRRRDKDSVEIQQMKASAKEERLTKQLEKAKLNQAKQLREESERLRLESEKQQKEMSDRLATLEAESRAKLEKLEADAKSASDALEAAEQARKQAEKQNAELDAANAEARAQAAAASAEARRQAEVAAAAAKAQAQAAADAKAAQAAAMEAARAAEAAAAAAATRVVPIAVPEKPESIVSSAVLASDIDVGDSDAGGKELASTLDASVLAKHDNDKLSLAEKNRRMQDQLKKLGSQLATAKDSSKLTKTDMLHQENQKAGREKYKTLRQIRSGNTRSRVDEFENM